MPRLSPTLVRSASRQSKYLASLLRPCRTLESASNELRWLKEHVAAEPVASIDGESLKMRPTLERLVKRRVTGEPLQYILGDQPFGDLEMLCRRNVLIPRIETEIYTTAVVKALAEMQLMKDAAVDKSGRKSLRILDLCSGSGCISLLLHNLLRRPLSSGKANSEANESIDKTYDIQVLGIDLSRDAIRLSQQNLKHNLATAALHPRAADEVMFLDADIRALAACGGGVRNELAKLTSPSISTPEQRWDILISNPPYVSPQDYAVGGRTENSVRNFEPRMALVPPKVIGASVEQADLFYPHILRIAHLTGVKLIVMEIGDEDQARRVRNLVRATEMGQNLLRVETWYDSGKVIVCESGNEIYRAEPKRKTKTGARAVVVWRREWARRRTEM